MFSVTQAPPSTVGRVVEKLALAFVARLRPMIEISPLGATCAWKFAAFTTPLLATAGAAVGVLSSGIRLSPDSVSTKAVVFDASTAIARPKTLTRCPVRAIAEGAGRILDVGLELVERVVELRMPLGDELLERFEDERMRLGAVEGGRKPLEQGCVAGNRTRIHQREHQSHEPGRQQRRCQHEHDAHPVAPRDAEHDSHEQRGE